LPEQETRLKEEVGWVNGWMGQVLSLSGGYARGSGACGGVSEGRRQV